MSDKLRTEEQSLRDLQQFLTTGWKLELLHDSIDQLIDQLIYELWTEAAESLAEDDDFSFIPSFSEVFHAVDVEDQATFIQDLTNVIRHCFTSENPWVTTGLAKRIASLRGSGLA